MKIGKWYLTITLFKKHILEVGIGENYCTTNTIYFTKEFRLLCFYLSITKPTLKYLNEIKRGEDIGGVTARKTANHPDVTNAMELIKSDCLPIKNIHYCKEKK